MEEFKRIVVKLGTNVLTDGEGRLDHNHIAHLTDQVTALKASGTEVLLVSSGAVTAGRALLPQTSHLNKVLQRQISSALGQTRLMNLYQNLFEKHGHHVAQVLATKEDFRDRRHYLNMQSCLLGLLRDSVIPILNENDVVAVTELMFTDNDELAGLVAAMVNARTLIILSSVDGVLSGPPDDPDSTLIPEIDPSDTQFRQFIFPARSSFGRGGMHTKFRVARKAARLGINTYIANGKTPDILLRLKGGTGRCTRFRASREQSSLKKWLAHHHQSRKGKIFVNEGAARALRSKEQVSSLLPVGVVSIEGAFEKGDIVAIYHEKEEIGIGMAQYSSQTAQQYLGKRGKRPLVHYDYLLVET